MRKRGAALYMNRQNPKLLEKKKLHIRVAVVAWFMHLNFFIKYFSGAKTTVLLNLAQLHLSSSYQMKTRRLGRIL